MQSRASPLEARAVMDALRRIVRVIRVSATGAERSLGLSSAQLFVLHQLAERRAESLGELAARTLTDPSSVSVVVARLVERKLVVRKAAVADGRRVELSLTREGRSVVGKAPAPVQVALVEALGRLPAGELRTIRRALESLVAGLGAGLVPASMFFEERYGSNSRSGASRAGAGRRPRRKERKK